MVKNTKNKNKEFNHDKNETTIQMFSYLGAGVMIRKTKNRVEVQNTIFHNKDFSITKMRIKIHNPVERRMKTHNPVERRMRTHNPVERRMRTHNSMEMWIKTYILMKMVKYNLNKSFKLDKVEKNENGVCKKQRLVDN